MTEQAQANSSGNTWSQQQAVSGVTAANVAAVAAMLLLEKKAIEAASGPLRYALSRILSGLAGRYVLLNGALDRPSMPQATQDLTDQLLVDLDSALSGFDPGPALRRSAAEALDLGLSYVNSKLADPVPAGVVSLPDEVEQLIQDVGPRLRQTVEDTAQFARVQPANDWQGVVQLVAKASQSATSLERTTSQVVAESHNSSIEQAAADRGARVLWIAEPDACVVCLALSGHLADPATGQWFDEEATFGKPGSAPAVWPPGQPLKRPPRHPHCRCIPELWFGPALPEGGPTEGALYNAPAVAATVDLPAALRREAKRSIVYGWSLPSESGTVRLKAAERLLARGAGLPKSVEAKGRKAVEEGKFDNRVHPSKRRTAHR